MKHIGLLFALVMVLAVMPAANPGIATARTEDSRLIVSEDITWTATESPYIITSSVLVNQGVTLTIEPGVTVKLDSGKGIQIDGQLIARGTEGEPILFTSNQPSPAPGDWVNIFFTDASVDATYDEAGDYLSGSIMQYCTVEYGGGSGISALKIVDSSPLIDHCNIRGNAESGIEVLNDSPRITNNTISNNGYGISAASAVTLTIDNNNISNNGYGIYAEARFGAVTINNNNISNNSRSGISAYDGIVTITNNTISNNSGGGIFANIHSGTMTISNNTISNNSARDSGGIYANFQGGTMTIAYNRIIGNFIIGGENKGGGINILRGQPTVNHNDIYSNSPCDFQNDNEQGSPHVDAAYNWWGTFNDTEVQAKIWDYFDDASLGIIDYVPFLTNPIIFGPPYTLTMHVSPPDSGTTTPVVGIHIYDAGTVVDISATPNTGYRFDQWSGDAAGTDPSTSITMDSDKDVTANFVAQYTLTIAVSPTDSGTTTPSAGIHYYDAGTVVDLSANPNSGYRFDHWSGDITSTDPLTTITMDSDKSVTANFVVVYTLTLNVSPSESGTTIPSPGSHIYDTGTVVDLTATPGYGWSFSQWSGDVAGTEPSTSITMDSNKEVIANFTLELETLEVETAIGEAKDVDGVAVIIVSIASVKDPVSGETVPGVPVADYSASVIFNPDFMEILEIRGGDSPFDTIPPENVFIDNSAGTASISDDVSPSGILPPIIIFRIVARLNDSALVSDNLSVNVVEASDPGGIVMSAQDQPMVLTFQRGDVQIPVDGLIKITDAMFGAQYVVGLRPLADIRPQNLASVKHDTGSDKINISDCLYIAQYVIGIRNENFELNP